MRSKEGMADISCHFEEFVNFSLVATATWLIAAGAVLPFIYHCKDLRQWCNKIEHIVQSSPLYTYHFWDEECAFYLDRPTIKRLHKDELEKLMFKHHSPIFVLARPKDVKRLEKAGIKIPWMLPPDPGAGRQIYLFSNVHYPQTLPDK